MKLVNDTQLDSDLTSVANAIRGKTGGSVTLTFPADFVSAINGIPTGITPTGTKSITISASGTTTEDVTNYASAAITVGAGTEGTPTATKGTVSSHAISVTPSVTNGAGYISGGTKTGTAVSVSASELVSGTYSVTSSGTKDVTNYASASVPAGTEGTPSATKGTVNNHSVSVTPSVTNTTGFITGSTKTGTAVTVSASELVSGSETKTANGTYDVTNLAELIVNVSGGGGGGAYAQFGPGTEYVGREFTKTINLKNDTSYDSWTASTTAGTIRAASSTTDKTFTFDATTGSMTFVVCSYCQIAYLPGATLQRTVYRWSGYTIYKLYLVPNAIDPLRTGAYTSPQTVTVYKYGFTYYYTIAGSVNAYANTATYGPIYHASNVSFFSSPQANNVKFKLPAFSARCENSYFNTSRKAEVDSANTNFVITVDVFKTPRPNNEYEWMIDQFRNDLLNGR